MDLSQFQFSCPSCKASLSRNGNLSLMTKRNNGQSGMIQLSTKIGDYSYLHEPPLNFEKGEILDFFCPHCIYNLDSDRYENFALINMKVDQNIEFEVLFSRVAGHKKTYVVTEDGVETYRG